jgi:hypothetical protein
MRLLAAAILVAMLLAACGSRPGITVSIANVTVPTVLGSTTESVLWSTSHGDAFPRDLPLTTVFIPAPVTIRFAAGQGASEIRGAIYDLDAPGPSGGPIEQFTVPGRTGEYESRSIVSSRMYSVVVTVRWSSFITRGEETYLFRMRVESR